MAVERYDHSLADPQATPVDPVAPEGFDFDAYADHEASRLGRCRAFWGVRSGVLVHRRMRVAEVFSHGCRDMKASLKWQLGALQRSMAFKADVPNFLEPWYGIGTVASAFGQEYTWEEGQAPVVRPRFSSVEDALAFEPSPIAETSIGRHTLDMIEYFLERTGGRLPMSLSDTQSPLNIACNVVNMESLFLGMYDEPQEVKNLLDRLAFLSIDFTQAQISRIGERIVWPGHGFASCRRFEGFGSSDDNIHMLSDDLYLGIAAPAMARAARPFGGVAFHSCGDWSHRIDAVKGIQGLRVVDGAFSGATDPSPNPPEPFGKALAGTGIVLNARIVGAPEIVADVVRRIWTPGLKLIAVTYCRSPDEQAKAYDRIHEICGASEEV